MLNNEDSGQVEYIPKNKGNSLKYLEMAYNEIEKLELHFRKLSDFEKNRMAVKFVEMNASPERYNYLDRFKEENIKKQKCCLNKTDLKKYYTDLKKENGSMDTSFQLPA